MPIGQVEKKNTAKPDISKRPLRSQSSKHCIVAHYLQCRKTKVQLNYEKSDPPQSPVTIKFNLPYYRYASPMDSIRMTFIWVGLFVGFRDLPISSASWKILTKVAFTFRGQ